VLNNPTVINSCVVHEPCKKIGQMLVIYIILMMSFVVHGVFQDNIGSSALEDGLNSLLMVEVSVYNEIEFVFCLILLHLNLIRGCFVTSCMH
jgi:hypothetical protein